MVVGFFHTTKEAVVMPSKLKKICAYLACQNLTYDTYCEEQQALRHK